jgi:hypothetical protein
LKKDILLFLSLFFLPLIISLINTLAFQICPPWSGILFYATFVIIAFFIGISLGTIILFSFSRYHLVLFWLTYLAILFLPLLEVYFRPQIYLYHSVFTFFPGTIYDDLISLDSKLLLFRFLSMLPFLLPMIYISLLRNHSERIKVLPMVLFVFLYCTYIWSKPILGFSTTNKILKENLTESVITPNFIINYPVSLDRQEINNLILHHEFYFTKIGKQTKIGFKDKIESYIFQSREQKRKLFGAGNADVAKPWLKQVYTQYGSYNSSLKHELIHVIAGEVGSTVLKIADNFNPSMIEGYAMAIENNYSGYDIHFLANTANESNFKSNIPFLFSGFNFLSGTSSISYIYAGSFVKYLIEIYGIEKVNKLYGKLNFSSIYGKSLDELNSDYLLYLENLDYAPDTNKAQLFFGRQSLFKRNCPRVTAQNLKTAWEHFNNLQYETAYEKFKSTYKYSANYSALRGSIESQIALKNYDNALSNLNKEIIHFEKSSYYFNLLFRKADIMGMQENYIGADSVYKKLLRISPSDAYTYLTKLRLSLLEKSKKLYNTYLTAESTERFLFLSKNLNRKNREYFLPAIIDLANQTDVSNETINNLISKVEFNNQWSSYYLFNKLIYWYLETNNWEKAKYYSELAITLVEKSREAISSENLEKTTWIAENADSILSHSSFR